ncbi:MAG: exo-alpha-sialidase [Planctomycetes bacterium]|nr:exo-alpha-sialidase [Planctomycetota bacterium]
MKNLQALLSIALCVCLCGETLAETIDAGIPRVIVPSDSLPEEVEAQPSNNNVAITMFEDRLFLAWRTSPNHFASPDTVIYILSSTDLGETWEFEHEIHLETDMREPYFVELGGKLLFYFFSAGTNPLAFEPRHSHVIERGEDEEWSEPADVGIDGEVFWVIRNLGDVLYKTSYVGPEYDLIARNAMQVRFEKSDDGYVWGPASGESSVVYTGGVSEVAFDFTEDGDLWAVCRNESGDDSGFGSHVAYASADSLGSWEFTEKSDPRKCDSPRMFGHNGEFYLIARRDPVRDFDSAPEFLPFVMRRSINLAGYSTRPKRTALFRLDREERKLEFLFDMPGTCGDTAFASIVKLSENRYLVANYTSPADMMDATWLQGQTSDRGTQITFTELTFE